MDIRLLFVNTLPMFPNAQWPQDFCGDLQTVPPRRALGSGGIPLPVGRRRVSPVRGTPAGTGRARSSSGDLTNSWFTSSGLCGIDVRPRRSHAANQPGHGVLGRVPHRRYPAGSGTRPVCPTYRHAKKASNPAPLPKSSTVMPGLSSANARGFPQPKPRFPAPANAMSSCE